MADGYEKFHDPATGQRFIRPHGSGQVMPVSDADVEVLEEGGLTRFMRSAAASAEQVPAGLGALLGVPGTRERFDVLAEDQALRGIAGPVSSFAGSAAPDVLIGAVTGFGGTLARRIGTTALVEGGLGASRSPDDPLRAGVIQGGIGAGIVGAPAAVAGAGAILRGVDNARGGLGDAGELAFDATTYVPGLRDITVPTREAFDIRAARRQGRAMLAADEAAEELAQARAPAAAMLPIDEVAEAVSRGGIGAEQVPQEMVDYSTRARVQQDLMTPDEVMAYSADEAMPMSWTQRGALLTRDADKYDSYNDLTDRFERLSSAGRGAIRERLGGEVPDIQQIWRGQRRALRKTVAKELGMGPNEALVSTNAVGRRMTEISDEMEAIWEEAGPIMGDELLRDVDGFIERSRLLPKSEEAALRAREMIASKVGPGGRMEARDQSMIRNELTDAILYAAKNADQTEVVEMLSRIRGALDKRVETNMEAGKYSGEVERLRELRHQWKLSLALTRVSNVIDADGNVSAAALVRSLEMMDPRYKTGRERSEFMKYLRTMEQLLRRRSPDSGTAARLAAGAQAWGGLSRIGSGG